MTARVLVVDDILANVRLTDALTRSKAGASASSAWTIGINWAFILLLIDNGMILSNFCAMNILFLTIFLESILDENFSSVSSWEPNLTSVSVTFLDFLEYHNVSIITKPDNIKYRYGVLIGNLRPDIK